jgi:hypothetical protein
MSVLPFGRGTPVFSLRALAACEVLVRKEKRNTAPTSYGSAILPFKPTTLCAGAHGHVWPPVCTETRTAAHAATFLSLRGEMTADGAGARVTVLLVHLFYCDTKNWLKQRSGGFQLFTLVPRLSAYPLCSKSDQIL